MIHQKLIAIVSHFPFGKEIREYLAEPLLYKSNPVAWRNHEASYDASELEPSTRAARTQVLQEYFVPVNQFDEFYPKMVGILKKYHVNVINISIRHARPDPGSLLAWANKEVFAFVLYYEQGTTARDKATVGVWTRELIAAALSVQGSYYLPYQIHATDEQFRQAYPRFQEFFALKQHLDPENKFRNKLWDAYYQPTLKRKTKPSY
jgi:FAD/FMN-containing dehydrogenase